MKGKFIVLLVILILIPLFIFFTSSTTSKGKHTTITPRVSRPPPTHHVGKFQTYQENPFQMGGIPAWGTNTIGNNDLDDTDLSQGWGVDKFYNLLAAHSEHEEKRMRDGITHKTVHSGGGGGLSGGGSGGSGGGGHGPGPGPAPAPSGHHHHHHKKKHDHHKPPSLSTAQHGVAGTSSHGDPHAHFQSNWDL